MKFELLCKELYHFERHRMLSSVFKVHTIMKYKSLLSGLVLQNLSLDIFKLVYYNCSHHSFSSCENFVTFQVHRLVVVDKEDHVVGVMSLSDLLQVLVLHPPGILYHRELIRGTLLIIYIGVGLCIVSALSRHVSIS